MNRHYLALSVLSAALLSACHSAPAGRQPVPAAAAPGVVPPTGATALSIDEQRLRDTVRAHHEQDVALLERAVNISSGSLNVVGVRQVGALFGDELRALGFDV